MDWRHNEWVVSGDGCQAEAASVNDTDKHKNIDVFDI